MDSLIYQSLKEGEFKEREGEKRGRGERKEGQEGGYKGNVHVRALTNKV